MLNSKKINRTAELERKRLIEFVRQHAESKGVSQSEIARRAGLHPPNVSRTLSGHYRPELDTFLKIVGALNLRIELKT